MKFAELESLTEEAIKHDGGTRALEAQWDATPNVPKKKEDVVRIDGRVDRTLVAIRNAAAAHAQSAEDDDEQEETAV